jgi:hypothetical protein
MKMTGHLRLLAAGWLSALISLASEHHGQVTFGGLPVRGAEVTATKGGTKATAITNGMGIYSFPDLADGTWSMQVEMSGFTTLKQDVGVGPGVPGVTFDLKLKSLTEIHAQVQTPALAEARPPGTPAKPKPTTPAAATVSGTAREFTGTDAEMQLTRPSVTLNGTPQNTTSRGLPSARGSLVWFYLPDHGRYILSLGAHTDLDFKKAGEVRGGAVTFTVGKDSIKLECATPIATGNAPYNLYVLHDPEWEPTAQAQKGQFAVGSVDPAELAALRRK